MKPVVVRDGVGGGGVRGSGFARNGPKIIVGRLKDRPGHAGDKGGTAVGLGADRVTVRAVNVDFRVDARVLRQAANDVAEAAVRETDIGDGGIFDLDVRMVQIAGDAGDGEDRAHQPLKNVEVVGRLINQDAAAFGGPFAAPRVRTVVRLIAPGEHGDRAENRRADLALVDGGLHGEDRFKKTPLADDAEAGTGASGGFEHAVAIFDRGRKRLFDENVDPAFQGGHRGCGVERMRRADDDRFHAGGEHRRDVGEGGGPILGGEGRGAGAVVIADGGELAERGKGRGVKMADLAAADKGSFHYGRSGKYWALMRRKNASEATISSIPFIPSSRLIQPAY